MLSPVSCSTTQILAPHEPKPYISEVYGQDGRRRDRGEREALVEALGKNPAITVQDKKDIRNEIGGMINLMLNMLYGLLAMALIIAVLGVINTLAMSVFERSQEIGMLRAIGLDRSRVKQMVRLESLVISLFGGVLGIGLGVVLRLGGRRADRHQHAGRTNWSCPWAGSASSSSWPASVGVLAALWPARSAARLNMLTAIKTE